MQDFLLLGILFFILWLWRDGMKTREQAIAASRRACEQYNVQLLDDTVVLIKLRLCRTNSGSMALCRLYSFDFTLDGEERRSGSISMRSQGIEDIVLDIDQTTILQ